LFQGFSNCLDNNNSMVLLGGFTSRWLVHVRADTLVYLVVVLKYLVIEVLELVGNVARDNKKNHAL
jgi:hypothetical protein